MFLHTGDQVGAYTIKQLVGQGGMATVYRAYHAQLDRDVAIKIMLQDYRDDPHFVARFEREARIVASLEHPHIVPVYDFNQHEGNPYLVMKYIEGRTLKQRLLKGALPLDEVLSIMSAVGDALTYAHGKGVLHRDIKPSNIVIDIQETPYITDFGLARMVHLGESTLSADMLLGTPHYIAPEQARGEKNL
ncbi:MAG: serine/threonine protein kinase, partial [Anaerolineae bacterium]|nr:serine/threonine protein kinase [Anaerolineae bacterium]